MNFENFNILENVAPGLVAQTLSTIPVNISALNCYNKPMMLNDCEYVLATYKAARELPEKVLDAVRQAVSLAWNGVNVSESIDLPMDFEVAA